MDESRSGILLVIGFVSVSIKAQFRWEKIRGAGGGGRGREIRKGRGVRFTSTSFRPRVAHELMHRFN